jgi:hypothetical protein
VEPRRRGSTNIKTFSANRKHIAILIAMENTTSDQLKQLNGLDQSSLQSLLGGSNGSTTSLIPDSLVHTLSIGFIALNVVSVLFLIVYILSVVRKWKVQTAILRMQKDVAELKAHMVGAPTVPAPAPVVEPIQQETHNDNEQPQS